MLNLWSLAQKSRAIRTNPAFGYPLAFALVCLAVVARLLGTPVLNGFPFLTFYPAVVVAAFLCGPGPAAMAAVLGAGLSAYFLFDDSSTLRFEGIGLWIAMAFYACTNALIIALMDAVLTAVERQHATARRLQLAMDAGGMAVWEYDLAGKQVIATPELNRLLGFSPSVAVDTADVQTLMMPDAWERLRAAASQAIHGGERYFELELQARRADGALRWYALCAEVLRAPGGVVPEKILGVLSDVTGRKEIEQTRELLLQELEHRIKNTLAIVSAIAAQTLRGDIAAAEARKVLDGRFSALAAAHELLTRHHWRDMNMQQVVEMALAPHQVAGQIGIEGPSCPLSPKRALALTLALHELATNAVKYGALSCPQGRVSVGWARDGQEKLVFTWRESGGPAVTVPQQRGFGSQIAERVLAAEFAGKVSLDFAPQGLICTLAAPLHDALSAS